MASVSNMFILIFLHCIYCINDAQETNAIITLSRDCEAIFSLFTPDEIWGIQYEDIDKNIVNVEVVIDNAKLLQLKNATNLFLNIIHSDVQKEILNERGRIDASPKWNSSMKPDLFFTEYRNWIEYELFLEALLFRHPLITSKTYLPLQTIQGRDIPVIKISGSDDDRADKPGFYIQAAVHSREWLANAAAMYILDALVEGYENDDRITNILDGINIFIAPTINIDGYIYTWQVNRMWRKNRRDNGDGTFGIDLNRNYDGPAGTWCSTGASTNPRSDAYCGSSAFSEPETHATALFMKNESMNIRAAFDLHTSGELIMYPWAYTRNKVDSPY